MTTSSLAVSTRPICAVAATFDGAVRRYVRAEREDGRDLETILASVAAILRAHVEPSPYINALSDIDGHQVNVPARRQPLGTFSLFEFSPKFDPVPSMLVQNHEAVLPDYFGLTTSFRRERLKPGVIVLAVTYAIVDPSGE